jgi:hypothetical protein
MTVGADRWIRWTTIGCVALLALIAGTVSYLHMHLLVELHGQPGWVAALTPLSVDGMIVAASTTLLADSRAGRKGGALPWALLVAGSVASLGANVAVAEPSLIGRVIAAWPSFALIACYELLMRQVRRAAEAGKSRQRSRGVRSRPEGAQSAGRPGVRLPDAGRGPTGRGREAQLLAWQWALANQSGDGALPSGRDIGRQHGRRERWGRLVKRSGLAGNWTRRPSGGLTRLQVGHFSCRLRVRQVMRKWVAPAQIGQFCAPRAGSGWHRGHVRRPGGGLLTGMPPWARRPCGRVRPRQLRARCAWPG